MRILIALLLAMTAFAGCLGDDEPADSDGDGFTDTEEEQAGSDPNDADDTPPPQGGGNDDPPADIQTEFSFGPGLGCVGDVAGPDVCITYQGGPGSTGPDGYWIELGPDYVGADFTSTVGNVRADSDCVITDANGGNPQDFSAGEAVCSGKVPKNAGWLFVYSYAEPHTGLTVTFIP